jgi:hypothetical protein
MAKKLTALLAVSIFSLVPAAPATASFGFRTLGLSINEAGPAPGVLGPPAVRAGSHPFGMTASFTLNETTNPLGEPTPDGNPKTIETFLPAGLVGDPNATPKCTPQQLSTPTPGGLPSCPDSSAVGVAELEIGAGSGPRLNFFPAVFNMVPPAGVTAQFGFSVLGQIPIVFSATAQPGGEQSAGGYVLKATFEDVSQALVLYGAKLTLWGVPADPRHDHERGECAGPPEEETGECKSNAPLKPLLTLPTSCGGPLSMTFRAVSWQEPGGTPIEGEAVDRDGSGNPVSMTGCDRLDFSPSLSVRPESEAADSPTGLDVDLHLPQNENPEGLAEAHLKEAVMVLPAGLAVNPAAADGLEACTPEEIGLNTANAPSCPSASKVGSVEVQTPLLEHKLHGSVYVAQQTNNPFGTLLALYLVAEGEGVLVKLAGRVDADPLTGQLRTTFSGNSPFQGEPQVPFSDLELHLYGGPRAALTTPSACGSYAPSALLRSWSSALPISPPIAPFAVGSSCGGGFAPSFAAGTLSNQAGGFSPFSVTLSRTDQDQTLGQVSVHTPLGLLGMLSKVALCGESQAAQGTCPAASQIGHVTAGVGAGPNPLYVPQAGRPEAPVFLTGPYRGAPFGLSIVVPAQAGPFDLGTVKVRAAIYIDPHTAQLTVVSDPLPRIVQGIPLDVRTVNVTIDRSEFIFNPTNCEPLLATGTIASTLGAAANLSTRFQAANCAALPFHPKFTVSTQGQTSKKNGAALDVKVASSAGQANIGKVVVSLPVQLPARLTTLQKACPEATFAQNPAMCPAASDVGTAKAVTPVLNEPVVGPAYLVSHGGAAFPDLVVILEGQGIRLDLVGNTSIKKNITTSTFNSVPDAPVSSFELKLPQGSHSVLTSNLPVKANGSLCGIKLVMPTAITGQNGAQVKQSTKIAVGGCRKTKAKKARARKAGHRAGARG